MRLITFASQGQRRLGVWLENTVIDAQKAVQYFASTNPQIDEIVDCPSDMLGLLQSPEPVWKQLNRAVECIVDKLPSAQDDLRRQEVVFQPDTVVLHAPLQHPGKVICIAGNYPTPEATQKPEFPIIFLKPSSSITGPGNSIFLSDLAKNVAYEVELAVVIGRKAHNIAPSDAMGFVSGFTVGNDVGDRLLEKRTSQWTSGKMFDSFTPIGPCLVTTDEIKDPGCLAMDTYVNGKLVQHGSTGEMFFGIAELVSDLSQLTTLVPGDLILTGSPKLMDGQLNPRISLQPGDQVTVAIESIGTLSNTVCKET